MQSHVFPGWITSGKTKLNRELKSKRARKKKNVRARELLINKNKGKW